MKKRGQVSTFVIVGIVLILIIGGFFVVKNVFFKEKFEGEENRLARLPEQIKPIAGFLDSCVNDLGKEAVQLVSLQGGYVDIPDEEIPTSDITPVGSSVEIIPNTEFKVPLWYRQRPNGVEALEVPEISTVEKEVSKYVRLNFDRCIEGLRTFVDQGYEVASVGPTINVATDISKTNIHLTVDYPISVKYKDIEFTIQSAQAQITSGFGELYEVAKQILNKQNEKYFFEKKTIELLVANDPDIPFKGVDTQCVPTLWRKSETINKLKDLLQLNIGALRVKGTDYTGAHRLMEFDALDKDNKNLVVNFMYSPIWPTFVEILPNQGDILKSDNLGQDSIVASAVQAFFCLNSHHFIYDIKYPVVSIIRNKETNEEFQFGFEVIVDNNQPRVNRAPVSLDFEVENQICAGKGADLLVATKTLDNKGGLVDLEDVDVKYKCYPAKCDVGVSRMSAAGESTVFGKVPFCSGGIVEGSKEGFFKGKTYGVSTNIKGQQDVVLILEPVYKKNVVVKVIDKGKKEIRDPYESEQITFNLLDKDKGYSTTLLYPDQKEIGLVVGDYEIKSSVIGESTWPINTPKQKVKRCIDINSPGIIGIFARGKEECTEVETEEMKFDYAPKGGAEFEFSFNRNDLASVNTLVFYTVAENAPGNLEEMGRLQSRIEFNSQSKDFKYPEFKE